MTAKATKAAVLGSILLLAMGRGSVSASAMGSEPVGGNETVTQYLTPATLEAIFPGADKVGEAGGPPPAAPSYRGGRQAGDLLPTWGVTQSKGFSTLPCI